MKVLRVILVLFLFILPATTALCSNTDNSANHRTATEELFVRVLFDQINPNLAELSENTNFRKDLGADDLDMLELSMATEETFDIEIPTEEWEKITTFESAIDLIIKLQASMD